MDVDHISLHTKQQQACARMYAPVHTHARAHNRNDAHNPTHQHTRTHKAGQEQLDNMTFYFKSLNFVRSLIVRQGGVNA